MNEKKMVLILAALLWFTVLSGCIDLVKNGQESIGLVYSKNGLVYFNHSIQGEKGELFFQWEGDCTQQAKDLLDANINFMQKQSIEIKNSANLNQLEKTGLIEENNRKINTLLSIKSTVKCELKDENGLAVLNYSFGLSQGFENIKLFNSNYDFTLVKSEEKIESKFKVNNTANQKTGNLLEKIAVSSSDSGIDKIEPAESFELKGEKYEIELLGLDGQEITVMINRKEKTAPPANREEKKDGLSFLIEGFRIENLFSLEKEDSIQWIPTILIALILVIIIAKLVKGVHLPEHGEEDKPKEKLLEDKVLEKEKKVFKKTKFEYMQQPKKINKQNAVRPKFTEEEKKQIQTIIISLKESFQNYSKEEIKKAVLGKGYSDKISQEVADFFYP